MPFGRSASLRLRQRRAARCSRPAPCPSSRWCWAAAPGAPARTDARSPATMAAAQPMNDDEPCAGAHCCASLGAGLRRVITTVRFSAVKKAAATRCTSAAVTFAMRSMRWLIRAGVAEDRGKLRQLDGAVVRAGQARYHRALRVVARLLDLPVGDRSGFEPFDLGQHRGFDGGRGLARGHRRRHARTGPVAIEGSRPAKTLAASCCSRTSF